MTRSAQRLLLFCFLALISIHGIIYVPLHASFEFKGLDFQNIYAFSTNCLEWIVPYGKSGAACGDVLGRPFLYPPLLYYVMAPWPRLFSFHQAAYIWEVMIVVFVSFGSILLWSLERKKKLITLAGFGMLFGQLPMFFALERGNNDSVVVLLWSVAAYLYVKKREVFWSGILLGTATAFKVYPGVGVVGILTTLAIAREWKSFRLLALGSAASFGFFFLIFFPSSWTYFTDVVVQYSQAHTIASYCSHSLFRGPTSMLIKIPLIGILGWGFAKRIKTDAVLCFAFFMTYGTFIPKTANDYSLVTAMPFALLLLHRSLRQTTTRGEWIFCLVIMFAFFGDRTPFALINFNKGHQLLFIACFLALPVLITFKGFYRPEDEREIAWDR